jgi:hypothetical protein
MADIIKGAGRPPNGGDLGGSEWGCRSRCETPRKADERRGPQRNFEKGACACAISRVLAQVPEAIAGPPAEGGSRNQQGFTTEAVEREVMPGPPVALSASATVDPRANPRRPARPAGPLAAQTRTPTHPTARRQLRTGRLPRPAGERQLLALARTQPRRQRH